MTQNENYHYIGFNYHSMAPFYDSFPAPLAARASLPFHLHAKGNFGKKSLIWFHQGSNP